MCDRPATYQLPRVDEVISTEECVGGGADGEESLVRKGGELENDAGDRNGKADRQGAVRARAGLSWPEKTPESQKGQRGQKREVRPRIDGAKRQRTPRQGYEEGGNEHKESSRFPPGHPTGILLVRHASLASVNVLFLNHNVAWHGVFFRAYHWGRQLVRRGHRVTIVTISEANRFRSNRSERDGVSIIKSPDLFSGRLRSGWDPWNTVWRMFDLRHSNFDVVHSIDSRPVAVLPALFLKKVRGSRLVLDCAIGGPRNETFERPGLFADILSPVETFFEEFSSIRRPNCRDLVGARGTRQQTRVPRSSITRIPQGADVEAILPRSIGRPICASSGRRTIGRVCRRHVHPRRAVPARRFREIRRRDRRVKLVLIGNTNIAVPADLAESGAVRVTGGLTYEFLQVWIASCDAMLLPMIDSVANRGRWPSKLNDYLAAGRPVVCSRVGDVASLVEDGACGILPGTATPMAFAEATLQLLASNSMRPEMGNARATAESKLDWRL